MGLKNQKQIGQFVWAPCPMVLESSYTLRIGSWAAGRDIAEAKLTTARIQKGQVGKHPAQGRVDLNRMVLPEIGLDPSEDFVVNKIKRRPCVLIHRDCYNMRKFSEKRARGPNRHIFAPIYSLRKDSDEFSDYPEDFIELVKEGGYPNLIYLPPFGTLLKNESMLVLNEVFSVAAHAIDSSDLTEYAINPADFGLLLNEYDEFLMSLAEDLEEKLK